MKGLNILSALAGLARLDAELDKAAFGRSLGFFGEKASDDELKKILTSFFGNEEESDVETDEEENLDEVADENVSLDTTIKEAFKKGVEWERNRRTK